jgi:hypothetical protein
MSQVISEYMGTERNSRILVDQINQVFIVECFEQQAIARREIFNSQNRAEDFAEDWVTCH